MVDSQDVWQPVEPEGLARGMVAVTILFTITTTIILAMRAYIRTIYRMNGPEDYTMYIGGLLDIGHNAAVLYGCYTGIGTYDDKLNVVDQIEGAKMITVWQLLYVLTSPLIKASICLTLIRIAVQPRYKIPLYIVIVISVATTVMAVIVVFVQCQPFEASWTGQGKCISTSVIIIPTYVFSVVNILVDWVVAIMPGFILWHVQLRTRLKVISIAILSVGVLASIATIIRMAYVPNYATKSNKLYKLGFVILWTVVELNLGIIAGSLPSLRKFFKSLSNDHSSGASYDLGSDLVTLGARGNSRRKASHGAVYNCELDIIVEGGRSGSSDGLNKDDDSTRRIIHVTRDITQTST